ncbi:MULTISPECIES: glycosyltransferase family 4 protein [unclassified Arthrobacter]|uniref:glycosyltransferase family 4 protein n=1 Tax=unclassified Arthrobacter TaxID=235627 RepID=UPI001C854E60|nr:glycosyltransferase family 4 protein [Arthrobacter sp. MAHUQ-56]MBX7444919.1 glycosyltransferase family 4 protein [Arthrobacter sp. MAHUQ-56]
MFDSYNVAINNGFGQFHLARLAENLEARGALRLFLTGAYPRRKLAAALAKSRLPALQRLDARRIEVPDRKVKSFWLGEGPHQIAQIARHKGLTGISESSTAIALDSYRSFAGHALRHTSPDIYHFRAGMGGSSLDVARRNGAFLICDHSIVHPRLLKGMIDGTGERAARLSQLWRRVESDMEQADHLLVNSDFVADTCIEVGFDAAKISVAYTGVDPLFLDSLDAAASESNRLDTPQVLFAGTLERRKGVDVAIAAAKGTNSPELPWLFMGNWEPDARYLENEVGGYIRHVPRAGRMKLAATLAASAIFVFPSRAEGSARVVAEALCAGCYVITTKNAGSIVRDGIDGRVVAVGDHHGIEMAIAEYLALGIEERARRAESTKVYARSRLNEAAYSSSVASAYSARQI